jgi:broad specificity phosphatase PhoE
VSVVLLVRHGQASWGADDYDVLSPVGERQAGVVGAALAGRGVAPDLVLHGTMKRQRKTARLLVEAAGWHAPVETDQGWNEMDHVQVLERQPRSFAGDAPTAREFQDWFEAATERWTHGGHDDDYDESFPEFGARVASALDRVVARLGSDGVAVVVTSGGPIARLAARLLGGGADLHRMLAPVVVNASATKVVVGRRGRTLVSFNDHGHLEDADPALLTYR